MMIITDPNDQYDSYYCYTPAATHFDDTEAQVPSPEGQYGHSWMLSAVKKRQELDRALLTPRAELQTYLKSPLEETNDVVGWWGISRISFNT